MRLRVKPDSFLERVIDAAAGRTPHDRQLARESAEAVFTLSQFIANTVDNVPQEVLDALDTLDTYHTSVLH